MANAYPTVQELEEYIRKAAQERYIDPDIAVRVAQTEGLYANPAEGWQSKIVNKKGEREPSFGVYQLYTGGGLGDEFKAKTGLDPSDPNNVYAGIDFALDHAATKGWGAFHGAANNDIGEWAGIQSLENGKPRTRMSLPPEPKAGNPAAGTADGKAYEDYKVTGIDPTPNVKNAGKPQINVYGHVDWDGVEPQVREYVSYASQHLGIPLNITSGYRGLDHPVEKKKGPGALHRHTSRKAIDLDVGGYSDETKQRIIETMVAMGATGVGIYPGGRMIHVDWSGLGRSYKGKGTLSSWDWSNKNPEWFERGKSNGLSLLSQGVLPSGDVPVASVTGAVPGMRQVPGDVSYSGGFYTEPETKTEAYVRNQNQRSMAGLPVGDVSYYDTWSAAQDKLFFSNQFSRMATSWNFENDPNWDRQKEIPVLLKEVPTDYWHRFNGVGSAEHAQWVMEQVQKEQAWDAKIAANGWTGFGSSMFFEVFHPLTLAGGVGAELAAMKFLGGAMKATRVGRIGRGVLVGGVGNLGAEAALDMVDERRRTSSDYAIALGAGMLLGGAFGIFSKNASVAEIKNNNQIATVGRQIVYGDNKGSAGAAYAPQSRMTDNAKGAEMAADWDDIEGAAEPSLGRKIGNVLSNIPLLRNVVNPITKAERIGATAFSIVRGIIPDPRGARNGEVVEETVIDEMQMFADAQMYQWKTVAEPQYDKWAKRTLTGAAREAYVVGVNDTARDRFFTLVRDYVMEEDPLKRGNYDPEVKAVGDAHAKMMVLIGEEAYKRGIFKDIEIANPPKIEEYDEAIPVYEQVQVTKPDGTVATELKPSMKQVEKTNPDGTKTIEQVPETEIVKKTREVPQDPTIIKFETNPHHYSLYKDEAKFLEINDKFAKGDIEKLVIEAFRREFEGASDRLLARLADGYINNLRKATLGMSDPVQRGMAMTDKNQLRAFLEQDMRITDTSLIDEFMNLPAIRKQTDGGTGTPRAKRRAFGREGYSIKMKLPYRAEYTGKRVAEDGEELSIRDFFVSNADDQMQRYIKEMSGSLAWANYKLRDSKTSELKIDGIRNDSDFAKLIEVLEASSLADNPRASADVKDLVEELKYIWNATTKNGGDNPRMAKIGRRLSQSMFNLLMQNLGVNAIQEVSNTMATAGIINTFKGVPALGRMLDDAGRSVPIDKTRRNLEALMGIGHKSLLGSEHYVAKLNRTGDENVSSFLGKAFDVANGKTQAVVMKASGFHYIDNGLQINAVNAMFNEFVDMSKTYGTKIENGTFKLDDLNNGFFSANDAKRMRSLGLSDQRMINILKNIQKHGDNLEAWDEASVSALRLALHRYYRRSIQQQDVGALSRWLTHPVAKVLLQFRNFIMVGMDKQFLYGLSHFDGRQAWQWTLNMALAGSVWYLYQKALSMGQKDPEEYMNKKFGEPGSLEFYRNIAMAGYSRSGFSTVLPSMWDTVAPALDLPAFNARTSGQPSAAWGAPFITQIDNIARSTRAIVKSFKEDRELARSEVNAIYRTFFGNHFIPIILTGIATQDRAEYPPREQR